MVSCASCLVQLQAYPRLFADETAWQRRAEKIVTRLVEFSHCLHDSAEVTRDEEHDSRQATRVYYHTPCHIRHEQDEEYSRQELAAHAGVALVELPGGPRCCGQGGLFHVAQPEISNQIRDALVEDVLKLTPDVITTTCSGCLMQWQQGIAKSGRKVRVLHLSQLLNELGAV